MRSRVANMFRSLISIPPHERKKLLFLTITFFCVIAAYTIIKELKDSIFTAVVGRTYIPLAKHMTMLVLIPAILGYSYLVDKLRRYQLLYVYSLIYGILGLVFAYLLSHPTIGLANAATSPYRIFGWIFYFFVEGYSPFMVSVFWAFANSISDPDEAKKNYGLMVSGSKMGGMVSAALAWVILSQSNPFSAYISTDIARHQLLLAFASVMVLIVPFVIKALMNTVSGRYLHGYEAAYKLEKERAKQGQAETGMFSGLYMFIKYPYLLGIFCMVFFYDVIGSVLSYQRIWIAQEHSTCVSDVSAYLFMTIFYTHLVGFLISLLGTRTLLARLGERRCLMLIPVATGSLLLFLFAQTQITFLIMFVMIRAINYGFSYPVRESLYIPTLKEIKFKSKSWIDSFGTKFAKSTGSTFNMIVANLSSGAMLMVSAGFFGVIIGIWSVAAWLLGRRYDQVVARNEVIGVGHADEPVQEEAKAQNH